MLKTAIWRPLLSLNAPQRACRGIAATALLTELLARKASTTTTSTETTPKRRRTRKAAVQPDAANDTDGAPTAAAAADEQPDPLPITEKIARPGSLLPTSNRQDVQRQRPPLSTFNKRGGFPRDLLRNLADFPHALLLTRVGQFYEAYFDQAIEISDLLKIRLTTKSMESTRYPMCGFPIAQMDKFMEKLVREHNRFVAVCEEFRTYDKSGGLLGITRKVVRVVTPGTLVDEGFLEKNEHNFLLAIDTATSNPSGVELAWIDTSTGELYTQASSLEARTLAEDLARINPAEVVLRPELDGEHNARHIVRKCLADLDRSPRIAYPKQEINDTTSEESSSAIPLLSAYIGETLLDQQPDLTHPLRVRPANTMRIDRVSLRALEMRQNNDGGRSGTLISVIDRTVTSAGMRMLSDRIGSPSKSLTEINSRLSILTIFKTIPWLREQVIQRLRQLDDEARLLQKMSIGRPTADDLVVMARAIRVHEDIRQVLLTGLGEMKIASPEDTDLPALAQLAEQLTDHTDISEHIESAVDVEALEARRLHDPATDPSTTIAQPASVDESDEDEGIDIWDVATGLDKKSRKTVKKEEVTPPSPRKAAPPSITWGKQESTVMQPNSSSTVARLYDNILRVENKAKRFYRDLSKELIADGPSVLLRVVPRFGPIVRVDRKRPRSPAMKEALSNADDSGMLTLVRKTQIADYYAHNNWTKLNSEMQGLLVQLREAENYAVRELCDKVLTHWHSLRRNASLTAELDVGTALAKAADELGYSRPTVTDSTDLEVVNGRHSVAEFELSKEGRQFIANTTRIDDEQRVHVITGPNMGGKSTVLRQVGLIAAMAQAGSYVPAESATIGVIDQLFARIRYSDNIARGRSSFRVEMDDAAYILDNATDRSLVLLDEFGRGTTADYAACIAEATVFALSQKLRARSLFATHLHDVYDILQDKELSQDNAGAGVAFFCTRMQADSEDENTLHYRYMLEPGINRDAEAFKVAQLAGYPSELLQRARNLYAKRSEAVT